MKNGTLSTLFSLVVWLWPMVAGAQCAMCKATAETNLSGGGSAAEGLNGGILYLMAFPYILLLIVGIAWYRRRKGDKPKA